VAYKVQLFFLGRCQRYRRPASNTDPPAAHGDTYGSGGDTYAGANCYANVDGHTKPDRHAYGFSTYSSASNCLADGNLDISADGDAGTYVNAYCSRAQTYGDGDVGAYADCYANASPGAARERSVGWPGHRGRPYRRSDGRWPVDWVQAGEMRERIERRDR
jgi:hypothetical protein